MVSSSAPKSRFYLVVGVLIFLCLFVEELIMGRKLSGSQSNSQGGINFIHFVHWETADEISKFGFRKAY